MNKNTQVLVAEYLESLSDFSEVYQVMNIEFAPIILYKEYQTNEDLAKTLTDWFRGRGIPLGRYKLDMLMDRLNITSPTVLLDKPFDEDIKYEDINFFDNGFIDLEFTEATFTTTGPISFYTK